MTSDGIPVAALQVLSVLIDELTSEIILKLEHRLEKFDALKVGCFLRNRYSALIYATRPEKMVRSSVSHCFV